MRTYQEIVQQPGKVEDCHAERGQAVWGGVDLQEELVSVNRRGLAYNPEYRQCQDQCGQDPSTDHCCSVRLPAADSAHVLQTSDAGIHWWYFWKKASE